MDQAEPEDQVFHWYQQECGHDPGLDCAVRLPATGIPQIPVEIKEKYAANPASVYLGRI
jgi:hypothetical protein